jgi:hypothetical protein
LMKIVHRASTVWRQVETRSLILPHSPERVEHIWYSLRPIFLHPTYCITLVSSQLPFAASGLELEK